MQLKMEFSEKLADLKPAIETMQIGIEGIHTNHSCSIMVLLYFITSYTEVLASESLREVFYAALITGNIINAVRNTWYIAVYIHTANDHMHTFMYPLMHSLLAYIFRMTLFMVYCNIHVHLPTQQIQGGRAGDAYGFKINSLRKLKDTRSSVPRVSLLHYISQVSYV